MDPPGFKLEEISTSVFRDAMKKFKPKKVYGRDWIDGYSLKIAAPLIEEALLKLINSSISLGKFARNWKQQLIFPLHKKNEKDRLQNHRPVSHLVQVGTFIEIVVNKQIYEYFEKNDLFHQESFNSHGNFTCP